jgi:hypothetical protein
MTSHSKSSGHPSTRIRIAIVASLAAVPGVPAQIVVSGYMGNPAGTDSPYEYVQLVATRAIDFSVTPYTVVVANSGVAGVAGWAAGNALTHGFQLTAGTVSTGTAFFVGGSGQLVNGSGSASLAGSVWIRSYNTGTTGGDGGLGTASSTGVFGNGGTSADGIGIFAGTTVTASSVPIDSVFYGSGVGSAYNSGTGAGYQVGATDHFAGGGLFGSAGNTFLFADSGSGSGAYAALSGTYDARLGIWSVPRSLSVIQGPGSLAEIESQITVVPESPWTAAAAAAASMSVVFLRSRRSDPLPGIGSAPLR